LLDAILPFQYVRWVGEVVDEAATAGFYVYLGYKFRPYPNNPYTQVPNDDENEAASTGTNMLLQEGIGLRGREIHTDE